MHVELMAQRVPGRRNKVARLMHKAGLLPKAIRRFRVTTDSRKIKASPDLVNRDFASEHPNDLRLSDITHRPMRGGWLYLTGVLDAYSRAPAGWATSRTPVLSPSGNVHPHPGRIFDAALPAASSTGSQTGEKGGA